MARDLVLITGATGFLGFRVLLLALQQGYQIRAAVRSEAKAAKLLSNPALKALNRDSQLSFVTVPDFLVSGAFDEAIKGVKYVIHVASPIPRKEMPDDDHDKWFVQQAVQGTLGVLESAQKTPSVKRIIVTSSVVANTGIAGLEGDSAGQTITAETRAPWDNGPYGDPRRAYVASKIAALVRAEEWIKEKKPTFDVIHIHPSYIFGRDELYESTKDYMGGTSGIALAVATGRADSETQMAVSFNHVADTARAHVLSLDPKVPGNQSFLLTNSGEHNEKWDDIFTLLEKRYPEEVEKGIFKKGSAWKSGAFSADVRKTEETFGFKLATLEEAVTPILDQYLELLAKEQR
jgi:nucleoside-diphosphate-sugar epimerase